MSRFSLFCCVLTAMSAVSASGQGLQLEGRYWVTDNRSLIRVEDRGLGTDIDLKSDLGIDKTRFPEGRISWESSGGSRLDFSFTPMNMEGDRQVTRTIYFDGREYALGTRVLSDLDIKHFRLGYTWQYRTPDGKFRIGPVVDLNGFLLKYRLRAPALNVEETDEVGAGIPTVGAAMNIRPSERVDIFATASGIKVGSYGYFVHADFGVRAYPVSRLFLTGGYRIFNLSARDDYSSFARVQQRGPYVGAGVRF